MGDVRPGVPVDLATQLRDALSLSAAVETGTYLGDSAVLLAQYFDQVWTIELAESLWEEARLRHASVSNVHFLHGASQDLLADVASRLSGPALYWLDGHWSGGATAGADNECPVLAEIAAVSRSPHGGDSAVLIDDARLFTAPPPPPHDRSQWPGLMAVCDALRQTHDRYVTVLEDVIIGVPRSAQRVVEDWGMASASTTSEEQRSRLRRRLMRTVRARN